MELAAWAPNASNRQDWRFTAVVDAETRLKMAEAVDACWRASTAEPGAVNEGLREYAGHFSAFREAPVLVAVDARRPPAFLTEAHGALAERISGAATSAAKAMQVFLLAAHGRGLGTCVYSGCVAAEKALAGILDFPRHRSLVAIVALGWPSEAPAAAAQASPGGDPVFPISWSLSLEP